MTNWKLALPAALACLVCCAPLLSPLIAGTALAGFGFAAAQHSLELGLGIAGIGLLAFAITRRWKPAAKSCGCAPGTGCNSGNTCNTPDPRSTGGNP
jgi:hypothetical protein